MLQFNDRTAPHQITLESHGFELRVCSNSEELVRRAEELLPPGWRPCAERNEQMRLGIVEEADGTCSVFRGTTCISAHQGLELSLVVLDGQIRSQVAVNARDRIFLHAGAVAHEGRAIIFPAPSFAGKTTITAAMVRAGAAYLSDEFAVLDADGRVHPYPKPLSVRLDRYSFQEERPVEDFGGAAHDGPVPLGLVVLTTYVPGARWDPVTVTAADAALGMLANAVPARTRPAESLRAIRRALEGAVVLQGDRGEADELAAVLLDTARTA